MAAARPVNEVPLTVRAFLEAGREELQLRLVAGEEHLDRTVREHSLNRPGLALSGFFRYFAHRRIQVFGLAETTYLKSLAPAGRRERLERFFEAHVPCVVLSRNMRALPGMTEFAAAARTPILRTRMITGRFLQHAAVLIEDLTAPRARRQGTMIDLMGIGVLIEGAPGVGKSETALGLMARGGCSLVADDVAEIKRVGSGFLQASAVSATRYHMEIRGLGIVHVPSLFGVASVRRTKRLDMIVRLVQAGDAAAEERSGLDMETVDVLGVPVPRTTVPVAPGRDATHIVEVAALNYRLRELGHDAAKELDQQLMQTLLRERRRASD